MTVHARGEKEKEVEESSRERRCMRHRRSFLQQEGGSWCGAPLSYCAYPVGASNVGLERSQSPEVVFVLRGIKGERCKDLPVQGEESPVVGERIGRE